LLAAVAVYLAVVNAEWARTPLGMQPEGEERAWLAAGESLHAGTAPREPFFRAPAYPALLAGLRDAGVSAAGLPEAAGVVNALAHLAATALAAVIARRMWRKTRAALLAGAAWGFYAPAVFQTTQAGPETLALALWLLGVAAALGGAWSDPIWYGGRLSRRHAWAYPAMAGFAFALAGTLSAPFWPAALAWPGLVLLLGREARGLRLMASLGGLLMVAGGVMGLQALWGGSPQPLAGADLYRLSLALEVTQPWAAPMPMLYMRDDRAVPDDLAAEAEIFYRLETGQMVSDSAVRAGYWWRRAVAVGTQWPLRSGLRAARKLWQLLAATEIGAGPDFARAVEEIPELGDNPLRWPVVLVLGALGLALGWRRSGVLVAVVLGGLGAVGALLWYPVSSGRAPVVVVLALLAGGVLTQPWPREIRARLGLVALAVALVMVTWLPRPWDPAAALAARDARQRAVALATMGDYAGALIEMERQAAADPTLAGRELDCGLRFSRLVERLPQLPSHRELESQLLDNNALSLSSAGAQFRCGACLWLLGRRDGALFYWRALAGSSGPWAATARAAIAASGEETPDETQRRAAWALGGSAPPDPAFARFFAYERATAKVDGPGR
jgi:hypothetical protein